MSTGDFLLRILEIADETFPTMVAMTEYEETDFLGVICAMIDMYAELNGRNKVDLAKQIYKELKEDEQN